MAGDQERVGPCFDVHARLETGNNALPNVESGAFHSRNEGGMSEIID